MSESPKFTKLSLKKKKLKKVSSPEVVDLVSEEEDTSYFVSGYLSQSGKKSLGCIQSVMATDEDVDKLSNAKFFQERIFGCSEQGESTRGNLISEDEEEEHFQGNLTSDRQFKGSRGEAYNIDRPSFSTLVSEDCSRVPNKVSDDPQEHFSSPEAKNVQLQISFTDDEEDLQAPEKNISCRSGNTSDVTSKNDDKPIEKGTPLQLETSKKSNMSLQYLFSIGKRKSPGPIRKPVLAPASSEDDSDFEAFITPRSNARKNGSKLKKRRSILGNHRVLLLPSESDEEDKENQDARVTSWVKKSPFGPGKENIRSLHEDHQSSLKLHLSFSIENPSENSKPDDEITELNVTHSGKTDNETIPTSEHTSNENKFSSPAVEFSDSSLEKSRRNNSVSKRNASLQVSLSSSNEYQDESFEFNVEVEPKRTPLLKSATCSRFSMTPRSKSPAPIVPKTNYRQKLGSSSDDDDDALESYFKKMREVREKMKEEEEEKEVEFEESLDGFIVDSDEVTDSASSDESRSFIDEEEEKEVGRTSEEEEEVGGTNEEEEEVGGISEEEEDDDRDLAIAGSEDQGGMPDFPSPLISTKTKSVKKIVSSPSASEDEKDLNSSSETLPITAKTKPVKKKLNVPKSPGVANTPFPHKSKKQTAKPHVEPLTFLASLDLPYPTERCHPMAVKYIKHYEANKKDLAQKLFRLFNEEIFFESLDPQMPITWKSRLLTTAGTCSQKTIMVGSTRQRVSTIQLASKVLDSPDRLRDTLIHEMCHAASWIISGLLGGHGPIWKDWAKKAMYRFPDLPIIGRCHHYEIRAKYSYKCKNCGCIVKRHSKSLDMNKFRCGKCRGEFELFINKKGSAASIYPGRRLAGHETPKAPNAFAMFVKENYKSVRTPGISHKDSMQMLSKMFAEAKISNDTKKAENE